MRSYEIPKKVVLEAFKKVKENRGAEGIDGFGMIVFANGFVPSYSRQLAFHFLSGNN